MKNSEYFIRKIHEFNKRTKKERQPYLYNILSIKNVASVMRNGLLCFYKAQSIQHHSIAMASVQKRRESVLIRLENFQGISVPEPRPLHSYANLYFTYWNPMMYKRKAEAETLCILRLKADVLDIPGCVISDRNAAARYAHFYSPKEGIDAIDFDIVFEKYWSKEDWDENKRRNHKAIKCAEVLIPDTVPYRYVQAACVMNENNKDNLLRIGFDKNIIISEKSFFRGM